MQRSNKTDYIVKNVSQITLKMANSLIAITNTWYQNILACTLYCLAITLHVLHSITKKSKICLTKRLWHQFIKQFYDETTITAATERQTKQHMNKIY